MMRHQGLGVKGLSFLLIGVGVGAFVVVAGSYTTPARAEARSDPELLSAEAMANVIEDYCLMCHSEAGRAGGLNLEAFDTARVEDNAEISEKIIRKLRTGMMPPSYASQPEPETKAAFAGTLETRIDAAFEAHPNPGHRTFQRLNRAEYARAIRDMLGLEVDVSAFLPPDTISHGFDNIADVQTMSATLMEGYLRAAAQISRDAVGDPEAGPTEATYKVSRRASQLRHVEGAPMGTRGGIAVVHNFPADGDYVFKVQLHSTPTGFLYGLTAGEGEQIEISIDGARVALLDIDPLMHESDPNGMILETEPLFVRAGARRVAAAFIQRSDGPVDDLMTPIEHTLADTTIGRGHGVTTLPHLRFFSVNGPFHATGVSETATRRRIFSCRPTSPPEELPCAKRILSRLASEAYRRPVADADLEALLSFYQSGADEGGFEAGIRTALQAILASPYFVFRLEPVPTVAEDGVYPLGGIELASRLSFFLWGTIPDDELRALGASGELTDPEVLEAQAKRLLNDPRAEALATRFAAQWLRLADLDRLHPDYNFYPQYDQRLAEAMRRETELFFDYLIREDRNVLEILTADYTFVNERLARHYGIPNVAGDRFRKVTLEGEGRRGILGQGSILTLTSIADRTSPVQRGKWVMEVLLGSPPPPPPPNVPALDVTQNAAAGKGKVLSVREAMEQHRANPSCASCHSVIDPLGLALENFDVTGAWRIKDNGVPVDPSGELYDGTPMNGPKGLRDALLKHSDAVITSFTESLLTYGLGRRVEYYDMPAVRKIIRDAAAEGNRMSSFILGVIRTKAFRMASLDTHGGTDDADHE